MKKLFVLLIMAMLGALCAWPAMAQIQERNHGCNVDVDVSVHKWTSAYETTFISKCLDLKVVACVKGNEWAQATVTKCDVNTHNDITEVSGSNTNIIADANLVDGVHSCYGGDPFWGFTGIAQVNQAAGSVNNQGNDVTVAATDSLRGGTNRDPKTVSHTEVAMGQMNTGNQGDSSGVAHTDQITDAFEYLKGIAQVNQASGSMNNQNNVCSVSANLNNQGAVALSDSFLTMSNIGNEVNIKGGRYLAKIDYYAFDNAIGVVQVNQSPGSMNNQANSIAISYAGFKK